MIYPPFAHFSLHKRPVEMDFTETGTFSGKVFSKLLAEVVDTQDKVIVDAIVRYATERGVTDLFLIDEEFIKSAIVHETMRRKEGLDAFT